MIHDSLQFHIVTPWKPVFEGDVLGVVLPTAVGQVTLLPNHIPLVSVVIPGEVIIQTSSGEQSYAVGGGFLEIRDGVLTLLADSCEPVSELDESRAEKALHAAITGLEQERNTAKRTELEKAKKRAEARLAVLRKLAGKS